MSNNSSCLRQKLSTKPEEAQDVRRDYKTYGKLESLYGLVR